MSGARNAPREPFRTVVEQHRETIVLAAHGELDIDSAGQLEQEIHELLKRGFRRMVLDLRGVIFMDSTGLHTILDASAASDRTGVEFAIVQGPSAVERVFELTNTAAALRFIDEREIDRHRR